jgi:hypothetical protein
MIDGVKSKRFAFACSKRAHNSQTRIIHELLQEINKDGAKDRSRSSHES